MIAYLVVAGLLALYPLALVRERPRWVVALMVAACLLWPLTVMVVGVSAALLALTEQAADERIQG